MADSPLYSRSGATSPFGKLTAEFPKFKAPEETLEEANKQARLAGMTLSEWVRTLVMLRVHGLDMVQRMHETRLNVVAGIGGENTPEDKNGSR